MQPTGPTKYKVFSFMAHDTFGKGQFVQHALLQNGRWPTLLTALEEFKSGLDEDSVYIDWQEFYWNISFQYGFSRCAHFIVSVLRFLSIFARKLRLQTGFNTWLKDQLRGVIIRLVYAKTEVEYCKNFDYMVHLASIGFSESAQ